MPRPPHSGQSIVRCSEVKDRLATCPVPKQGPQIGAALFSWPHLGHGTTPIPAAWTTRIPAQRGHTAYASPALRASRIVSKARRSVLVMRGVSVYSIHMWPQAHPSAWKCGRSLHAAGPPWHAAKVRSAMLEWSRIAHARPHFEQMLVRADVILRHSRTSGSPSTDARTTRLSSSQRGAARRRRCFCAVQ
jgi:hypothetical protein